MTENKIEELFRESILISDDISRNSKKFAESSKNFDEAYRKMDILLKTIDDIAMYNDETKKAEAAKFSRELEKQINIYRDALLAIDYNTGNIEDIIKEYNRTIENKISGLVKNIEFISQTLEENEDTIIQTAKNISKKKRDLFVYAMILSTGIFLGTAFFSIYPISVLFPSTKLVPNDLG